MKFYGLSWKGVVLSAFFGIAANLLAKNVAYNTTDLDREAVLKKLQAADEGEETETSKG